MALPGSNSKQANDAPAKVEVGVDQAYVAGSPKGYREDYSASVKWNSKGGTDGK